MYWPNLELIALPVPEIIAIGVLGGVRSANTRSKEGEAVGTRGSGMVPFERTKVSSYRPP